MNQNSTIVTKLIFYFLLLNIFTVIVIGSYSYFRAKNALVERTFDQLTSIRIEKKYRIEQFFNDRINDINQISKSDDVKNILRLLNNSQNQNFNTEIINQGYDNFLQNYFLPKNYFKRIYFINKNNQGIYLYTEIGDSRQVLQDKIFTPLLKNLLIKIDKNPNVSIEDYKFDSITKQPTIFMGTKVSGKKTELIGKVVVEINIDAINSIMFENNPHNGLGESGESYLVGADSLMRSTSRFVDNSIFKTLVKTEGLQSALNGETGTKVIKDYRNISVLSSYSEVELPDLNWAILAEIDEKEAMIPIYSIRNNILYLSVLMSLLLFAFVYIIAKRISMPIIKLKQATKKISSGNYDVIVKDIVSDDEIGSLINAFNEMSIKIKEQTENLNLERSMRLSSMIDGQELERQRLSRELHDGLGQSILAIKMRLERTKTASPVKSKIIMEEVLDLFANIINEIRSISNNLMPAVLNEFGLIDALSNLCREFSENAALKIEFKHENFNAKIDDKLSTYLYRISQEALSNIVKHAKATSAQFELISDAENVFLNISDDGSGFCYKEGAKICGNGISNMKERVSLLNGSIQIKSSKKIGTIIKIQIPINI